MNFYLKLPNYSWYSEEELVKGVRPIYEKNDVVIGHLYKYNKIWYVHLKDKYYFHAENTKKCGIVGTFVMGFDSFKSAKNWLENLKVGKITVRFNELSKTVGCCTATALGAVMFHEKS